MSRWKYLVQRATTGRWLHTDLPFDRDSLRWELSASGALSGAVAPDLGGMLAEDGKPLLDEWSTLIYVEADGIIRWGGIVISSKFAGSQWKVEAAGFTSYPHGVPFGGSWALAKVDPAKIVRDLWAHVQGYPDGDLGVTVKGSTSLRIGTDSTAKLEAATAAWESAKAAYNAANKVLKARQAVETAERKKYSPLVKTRSAKYKARTAASKALSAAKKTGNAGQIAAAQAAYDAAKAAYESAKATAAAQKAVVDARAATKKAQSDVVKPLKTTLDARAETKRLAKEAETADGGAYKLEWWDSPDVGDEIDSLAQETPFDFTETHKWNADKTDITHTVTVHYPRAGRRREDLAFTLGENITEFAEPFRDGDRFANEVIGLGAGEGAGSLRRTTAVRDGRLRRPYVLAAKDVTKATRLSALIRDEHIRRKRPLTIPSITVRDHPHAPIGSWVLGDDILVKVTVPWLGDVSIWHRIVGWELLTEHTASLDLERSDTFTYGA